MSRLKYGILILSFTIVTAHAADPFSFQSNGSKPAAASDKLPPPLSDEDYSKRIKDISKQSQKEVLQQSQSLMNEQEKQIPLPTPPASTGTTKPTDPFAKPPANNKPQKTTPPAFNADTGAVPTEPPAAAPAPATEAPPPAASQPYTGFGTGSSSGGQTTTPPPSGGGWNVKY